MYELRLRNPKAVMQVWSISKLGAHKNMMRHFKHQAALEDFSIVPLPAWF